MAQLLNIGKGKDNHINIESGIAPGIYAQLIVDLNGTVFIHDLQSTCGVYVNDLRISDIVQLQRNDVLRVGSTSVEWTHYIEQHSNKEKSTMAAVRNELQYFSIGLVLVLILAASLYGYNQLYGSSADTYENSEVFSDVDSLPRSKKSAVKKTGKGNITYDFSCVVTEENRPGDMLGDLFNIGNGIFVNSTGVTVSVEEEMEYGEDYHVAFLEKNSVIYDERSQLLDKILRRLIQNIEDPKGFRYKLFLVDSDQINAWTAGGHIYFTTAMYDFIESEDEIAAILGHEIYHNELGHLNSKLASYKASNKFWGNGFGAIASMVDNVIRSPFGKKDEAHCDFKGSDLCYISGFQPCNTVYLWQKMSKKDGRRSSFDEFLSSHPLSSQRSECVKKHLADNYNMQCNK